MKNSETTKKNKTLIFVYIPSPMSLNAQRSLASFLSKGQFELKALTDRPEPYYDYMKSSNYLIETRAPMSAEEFNPAFLELNSCVMVNGILNQDSWTNEARAKMCQSERMDWGKELVRLSY